MNSILHSNDELIKIRKIKKNLSELLKVVHPYDRAMAFASAWMWYTSYFVDDIMKIIMRILAIVSFFHWIDHDDPNFFNADIFMARFIIIWALCTAIDQEDYLALEYLVRCLSIYIINSLFLKCRKRSMQKYKLIYLIPHSAFRLYAFMAIMHVSGQYTTNETCAFYWLYIFGSGLPINFK